LSGIVPYLYVNPAKTQSLGESIQQNFGFRENHVKRYDTILFILWMGLSLFVMFFSNRYGLGTFRNPGAGLMPFLVGLLLLMISAGFLVKSFSKTRGENKAVKAAREGQGKIDLKKISIVLASLFAYGLLLERLGYLIVTLFTMILLFWCVGVKRWRSVLLASGLTVLITYFLFTYLGVRFPPGLLRSLL
jgi:hypothetical protein